MSVRPWRVEIRFYNTGKIGPGNLGAGNLGSRLYEYILCFHNRQVYVHTLYNVHCIQTHIRTNIQHTYILSYSPINNVF